MRAVRAAGVDDDVNAFRAGNITAQQATAMWLRNWRQGAQELDVYQAELRQADRTHC